MRGYSLILVAAATLGGCASEQWYGAGQLWQRQECNKIPEAQQRNRCTASTNTSYGQYQREVEAVQGTK